MSLTTQTSSTAPEVADYTLESAMIPSFSHFQDFFFFLGNPSRQNVLSSFVGLATLSLCLHIGRLLFFFLFIYFLFTFRTLHIFFFFCNKGLYTFSLKKIRFTFWNFRNFYNLNFKV
jgi:hypothetical protein